MTRFAAAAALLVSIATAAAAREPSTGEPDADGWIDLFDGETTRGWTATGGKLRVENGALILRGDGKEATLTPAIRHRDYELVAEYEVRAELLPFAEVALEKGDDAVSVGLMGTAGSTLHLTVLEAAGGRGATVYTKSKVASHEKSSVRSWLVHAAGRGEGSPTLLFRTTAAGAELRLRDVRLRPLEPGEPLDLPPALRTLKPRIEKPRPAGDAKSAE